MPIYIWKYIFFATVNYRFFLSNNFHEKSSAAENIRCKVHVYNKCFTDKYHVMNYQKEKKLQRKSTLTINLLELMNKSVWSSLIYQNLKYSAEWIFYVQVLIMLLENCGFISMNHKLFIEKWNQVIILSIINQSF
jgi:hypothetical protein